MIDNVYTPAANDGDNGPALTLFCANLAAQGVQGCVLPAAHMRFDTPLSLPTPFKLVGQGMGDTILLCNYPGDFFTLTNGAYVIQDMAIYALDGISAQFGIRIISTNEQSPDYTVIENVGISAYGSGSFAWPLHFDGTQRTSPIGLRDLMLRNVDLFAGRLGAAQFDRVIGFDAIGLHTFPAGSGSGDVLVGYGSDLVNLMPCNIQGQLTIVNSSRVLVSGNIGSLNVDGTSSYCRATGVCQGAINGLTAFLAAGNRIDLMPH